MKFESGGGDFGRVAETVRVWVVGVDVWWKGIGRWELSVFAVFVHEDYTSVAKESHKCIFGSWYPFYLLNG